MPRPAAFFARPFAPWDREQALELATAVGVPGIYVANWLMAPEPDEAEAEVVVLAGEERFLGLCFFGVRGNLVILERTELEADAVAEAVTQSRLGWRIALARRPIARALARREAVTPLVEREQIWYGVIPEAVPAEQRRQDVRAAGDADLSSLVRCALELNSSDLRVEPRRVNRAWLEGMLRRRIRDGTTRILDDDGSLAAKLDLGSRGPFGLVLEGVFTTTAARGRGLATSLVATVASEDGRGLPIVCLHVAATNASARRAYEKAGMREVARCGLLLRG